MAHDNRLPAPGRLPPELSSRVHPQQSERLNETHAQPYIDQSFEGHKQTECFQPSGTEQHLLPNHLANSSDGADNQEVK